MTSPKQLVCSSRFSAVKMFAAVVALLLPTSLYADWTGMVKKPAVREIGGKNFYEIESPENLAWFAIQVNKGNTGYNAVLKNDVAVVDTAVTENSVVWTPIGDADSVSYKGIFDGNGYTISGIYTNAVNAGFFGFVGPGSVIKNLSLENVLSQNYKGNKSTRAGLLSSVFSGDSVINVSVAGTVSDSTYAGGLAAVITSKAYIERFKTDIVFVGKVAGTWNKDKLYYSENQIVGGVAAVALDSLKILNSHVSIVVSDTNMRGMAGGFIGIDSSYVYFEKDTNTSRMVFENLSSTIDGVSSNYAGFVMHVSKKASADFVRCLNRGQISGTRKYSGGFIGECHGNASFVNSVNEGVVKSAGTGSSSAGGFVGHSWAASGSKDTISISFEYCVNKGYVFSPDDAGGFVGWASRTKTTILNSENTGDVKSGSSAGFVGDAFDYTLLIDSCKNTGVITGSNPAGFVSSAYGRVVVDHSVNEGDIIGGGSYVGGIIASIQGRDSYFTPGVDIGFPDIHVRNSVNKGKVTANLVKGAGGIVGHGGDGFITDCKNYGDVVATVGYSSDLVDLGAGGISGVSGTIENTTNYGNVSLSDPKGDAAGSYGAGGISGISGYAKNCNNKGSVYVVAAKGRTNLYTNSYAGGINGIGSALYCVNEGRVTMVIPDTVNVEKSHTAGITMTGRELGGNINRGVVETVGGGEKADIGALYGSLNSYGSWPKVNVLAGSLSFSDSVVRDGHLTAGSMKKVTSDVASYCSFFNNDIYKVEDDVAGLGVSTAVMQTEEFAWRLNTCEGKVSNSGFWSQHGANNPIWADEGNHAIYKVTFWDSSKVINVNEYKIGESLTNYKGVFIDMPAAPDPSDADDDLKFGYWSYGDSVIGAKTVINGDYRVYANYVDKSVIIESSSSEEELSSSSVESSASVVESSSSSVPPESSSSEEHTTVVVAAPQKQFNVIVNGMTVMLTNAQGRTVRIFDMLGHLVVQKPLSAKGSTAVTLQMPGSYIVRVNGNSRLVSLR